MRHQKMVTTREPMVIEPFKSVQLHSFGIDVSADIEFTTPEGNIIDKHVDRLWLSMIIDVATTAVLGWHLSINKEYSAFDILACIRNALIPSKPNTPSLNGLSHPAAGGFYSSVFPDLTWSVWDELIIDADKAILSTKVIQELINTIGCTMKFGPSKALLSRSFLEKWFRTFEINFFFHRLHSRVENVPGLKKANTVRNATPYKIKYEHLLELTEFEIATYNGSPKRQFDFVSPLERLKDNKDKFPIRKLSEESQAQVINMSSLSFDKMLSRRR